MSTFFKVVAKVLSLAPLAYLAAVTAGAVLYPNPSELAKRLAIAVNAGILASLLYLAGVLIYRAACLGDSVAFVARKKWFVLTALPLLTFFPIGFVVGGAVVLYVTLAKTRASTNPKATGE